MQLRLPMFPLSSKGITKLIIEEKIWCNWVRRVASFVRTLLPPRAVVLFSIIHVVLYLTRCDGAGEDVVQSSSIQLCY